MTSTAWDWAAVGAFVLLCLAAVIFAAAMIDRAHEQQSPFRPQPGRSPILAPLPCLADGSYASVPEPRLEIHKDVMAGTLHNPWLVTDIRIERTRNLPGPDRRRTADSALQTAVTTRNPQDRAGELATYTEMGYWKPNGKDIADVLPARVIAALTGARADDTVTSGQTFQRWVRDFLTCDLADLPLAVRADKLGLAVGKR